MYSAKKESYLTFNNYHVVPIDGLQPEDIKRAAGRIKDDREDIKPNTVLNHICKSLGFRGGFAFYQKHYQDELVPFLRQHNLLKLVDLLEDTDRNNKDLQISFTHRQLADSLFKSGRDIPKRIFIGHDVQLIDIIKLAIPKGLIFACKPDLLYLSEWEWEKFENSGKRDNLIIADKDLHCWPQPALYQLQHHNQSIKIVGGICDQMMMFNNLIGTQFFDVEYKSQEIITQYYDIDEEIINTCNEVGRLLNKLLLELNKGWINIIPFNDNLIFLSDGCGNYDFVFRDMRNEKFEHNIYYPYLNNSDIPRTGSEYDFQRWLYFPNSKHGENRKEATGESYGSWLENDMHESEKYFYSKPENNRLNYPGINQILKQYFIDKKIYSPLNKACAQGDIPTNFGGDITEINGKKYWVSDLVTIKDFFEFFNSSEYRDYRSHKNDRLKTVNADAEHLPVAVSWYDAMAYIRWIQDKHKIPVRLLNADEYSVISAPIVDMGIAKIEHMIEFLAVDSGSSNAVNHLKDSDIKEIFEYIASIDIGDIKNIIKLIADLNIGNITEIEVRRIIKLAADSNADYNASIYDMKQIVRSLINVIMPVVPDPTPTLCMKSADDHSVISASIVDMGIAKIDHMIKFLAIVSNSRDDISHLKDSDIKEIFGLIASIDVGNIKNTIKLLADLDIDDVVEIKIKHIIKSVADSGSDGDASIYDMKQIVRSLAKVIRAIVRDPMSTFHIGNKNKIYYFYNKKGELIKGHPDYMPEEQFQELTFKYREDKLNFAKTISGLTFIESGYFYEWLFDRGDIINARQRDSIYGSRNIKIRNFAPDSTGKYKHIKIGFRMICCVQ